MKHIKKLSVIMLICAIIMQMFVCVGYASVNNEDIRLERLEAFGIIDSAQTYDLISAVSRGDFVAMLMKASNSVPVEGNVFTDISSDDKNAGYINSAYGKGIVSGYGDGIFNPNASVNLREAAKMILAVLGYGNIMDKNSPLDEWMRLAAENGFLRGVSASADGSIDGLNAVKLINNLLDTNKYINRTVADTYFVNESDCTAIEYFFKVDYIRAEVLEVSKKKNSVKIRNTQTNDVSGYSISENVEAETLFGTQNMYVDNMNKVVVYVGTASFELIYDYISVVNKNEGGAYFDVNSLKKIIFKNSGEYMVDEKVEVYENDVRVPNGSVLLSDAFVKAVVDKDYVKKLCIYTLNEGGILYRADSDTIKYSDKYWDDNVLSGFEAISDIQIIIDGKSGYEMTDLKTDMVFDYYKSENMVMIVASSRKAKGVFGGYSGDSITVGNEELNLSRAYGAYVYSGYYQKYMDTDDYSDLFNKEVYAFVDDNQEVRFIREVTVLSGDGSFVALVTGAESPRLGNGKLSLWPLLSSTQESKIYEVKRKLAKNSLSFDYVANTARAYDGSNLFKFKVNEDGLITSIEKIEYFGNEFYYKEYFNDFGSSKTLNNIYCGDAILFSVFDDPEDGEYTIKVFNASSIDSCKTLNADGVKIISDFDMMNNPVPNYVLFADGMDQLQHNGVKIDIITDCRYQLSDTGDVVAKIEFSSGASYKLTEEYAKKHNLRVGTVVSYQTNRMGKNPLKLADSPIRELYGEPENWSVDTYTLNAKNGFYKAEGVTLRNGTTIQFMINGAPSNVYMLYSYWDNSTAKVVKYENGKFTSPQRYLTGYRDSTKSRSYMKSLLTAIQRNDNVWFHINDSYQVDLIVFESNNTVN